MDYTSSLFKPIIEPNIYCCQIYLYTYILEEELNRDCVTIASLQDKQLKTELQFQGFQLQTQYKLKMIKRKLNKNNKVVKRIKLATEKLGQAME